MVRIIGGVKKFSRQGQMGHGTMVFKNVSFGICLDDHLLAIDAVVSLGQEVLRGKVHLSRRRFALAAWNDSHLLRRQPCCKAINPNPPDANMQLCRGALLGKSNSFIILSGQLPEEPQESWLSHLPYVGGK